MAAERNGRSADRAVKNTVGMSSGNDEMNGAKSVGVDAWRELICASVSCIQVLMLVNSYANTIQPSSKRRVACSHVRLASSVSTVPPDLPSECFVAAVAQVLTTKLVLDSRGYGCEVE